MKPTALRLLAIPLSLITFALNAARAEWFDPITYDMSLGWGWAAQMAGSLVAMLPVVGYLALCYRRPKHFANRDGHLVAPADPTSAGFGILAMGIAGPAPFNGGHDLFGIVVVLIFASAAAAMIANQRPRLELDREGLTIRHLNSRRIAWDRLAPGGPPPPRRKRPREITVVLNDQPVNGMFRPSISIPTRSLYIDATYLAERIRYYAEHPEARSEIGAGEPEAALPGGGKPQGAPSI